MANDVTLAVRHKVGDKRPERLSPRIAQEIRRLIIGGEAPGGAKLRAEHLAVRFGVSATPVREALMALHGEGLVSFDAGRGFTVMPITRRDLLDMFYAQAHFAGELAARAAEEMTSDCMAELWRHQEALTAALESGDNAGADQVEFEFHRLINHASDSPKMRWLLKMTTSYMPFGEWHDVPGWAASAPTDHLPLLRALSNGSPQAAQMAMTAHIMNVSDLLAGLLAERGVLAQ
ncbi:GntR family transcriptional regulator [[Mycobacterium] crassicus]|uniref:GntR family transcriptional regulator n=1 Tax=[Mycobacterium] crassicus TaxID=2872309 RepID=A0ABU5XKK2_9MYCO|nr:GntR family transcriptional regulator [Mycolicibacter sp. MYC098]MEB3022810.1 GntR family transcriptional regulator [Mycolicibacter sp. MYC098]